LKDDLTDKGTPEKVLIRAKLNEYGILNNKIMYHLPCYDLYDYSLDQIDLIEINAPQYLGLIEKSQVINVEEDKFWVWKKEMLNKAYLALKLIIEQKTEVIALKALEKLESCPDPELAKEEYHALVNREYGEWYHYRETFFTTGRLKIENEILTWLNELPFSFWKMVQENKLKDIHYTIKSFLFNPAIHLSFLVDPIDLSRNKEWCETKIFERINEAIQHLGNYKFVKENYKKLSHDEIKEARLKGLKPFVQKQPSNKARILAFYLKVTEENAVPELSSPKNFYRALETYTHKIGWETTPGSVLKEWKIVKQAVGKYEPRHCKEIIKYGLLNDYPKSKKIIQNILQKKGTS